MASKLFVLLLMLLILSFDILRLPLIPTDNFVPRALFLASEMGREKALALAGYMTTKHSEFVGALN